MKASPEPDRPFFRFQVSDSKLAVDFIWLPTKPRTQTAPDPTPMFSFELDPLHGCLTVWGAKFVFICTQTETRTIQSETFSYRLGYQSEPEEGGHCRFELDVNQGNHRLLVVYGGLTVLADSDRRVVKVWDAAEVAVVEPSRTQRFRFQTEPKPTLAPRKLRLLEKGHAC